MPRSINRRKSWKETSLASGFSAVSALDNLNIYSAFASLALLNIFKDGMWMKILPPYTLFLSQERGFREFTDRQHLDPREVVGATLGVYGVTRAVVSIIAGLLINRLGAESTFVMTGWLGIIGVCTNCCCLWLGSINAIFFLMFVWGGFDGLWGSCLEVVWARSIVVEKREDVTWARQVVNQCTRALGPILSLLIFLRAGNHWRIEDMRTVMLIGTILSIFPVLICFRFQRQYEIRQEVNLCDVNRLLFDSSEIEIKSLKKNDCIEDEAGRIKISNFADSKMGKLRIMKADLRESGFILGEQFRARFRVLLDPNDVVCTVHFEDPSRDPQRVAIESMSLFLRQDQDQSVNTEVSSIVFNLYPELIMKQKQSTKEAVAEMTSKMLNVASPRKFGGELKERLLSGTLAQPNLNVSPSPSGNLQPDLQRIGSLDRSLPVQHLSVSTLSSAIPMSRGASIISSIPPESSRLESEAERVKREGSKRYTPNLSAANMILVCELLHALAAGFSLRFIDLFLIQDYDLSPAAVLFIAFLECCCGALLASPTQQLMTCMRRRGNHAKSGALTLWGLSLLFLGILCVPGMPLVAVALAVILMQALNSAPKAYLRIKLLNYLPTDRVALYMVWDSLNKATQGGITVVGAAVIRKGQYQSCFLCTFGIMLTRFIIYGAYTARRLQKNVKETEAKISEGGDYEDVINHHPNLQIDTMESYDRGVSVTLDTQTDRYVDIAATDPDEEFPARERQQKARPSAALGVLRESRSEGSGSGNL